MVKHSHLTQKTRALSTNLLLNHYSNVQILKNFARNFHFSQISTLGGNTGLNQYLDRPTISSLNKIFQQSYQVAFTRVFM